MEWTEVAVLDLDTRDRFIYEYGRFILEWNSFEFYVEALIWYVRAKRLHYELSCTQNFREINHLPPNAKRGTLIDYLRRINEKDVLDAVNNVYDVAERNKWIHGFVLQIMDKEGDEHNDATWRLFRLNKVNNRPKLIHITESDPDGDVFVDFHEAWTRFRSKAEHAFGFLIDVSDCYLVTLSKEEQLRRESQSY